jgi:hypothetical protein
VAYGSVLVRLWRSECGVKMAAPLEVYGNDCLPYLPFFFGTVDGRSDLTALTTLVRLFFNISIHSHTLRCGIHTGQPVRCGIHTYIHTYILGSQSSVDFYPFHTFRSQKKRTTVRCFSLV